MENETSSSDQQAVAATKVKKYQSCGICCLVTGIVLFITSCFIPKTMDSIILAGAKKSSQLTEENEANWKGIPGELDIGIYWNQYFYNCTNAIEVTYSNAKPEFQEFGPFIYRESDLYENLDYSDLANNIDGGSELPSVSMLFSQGVAFESDPTGDLDVPMYLTNQALFGVWYQQNAAQAPDQVWRVYLTLIWSAVQDGLGRQLVETGTWQQMYSQKFSAEKKINDLLVHDYPVTDEQEAALYDDPYYGLSDYNNYVHWQNLMTTTDPIKLQMQVVWYWELRTYFGLSFNQVQEMAENWNKFYNEIEPIVYQSIPAQDPYHDQTGVAYWQWADSYLTKRSIPPGPSVLNSTDTVTGYVEYFFWKKYYCDPENVGAMSQANWDQFSDVEMYRSTTDPEVQNFEYLFDLVDPVTGGDPAAHSLFNLTTLKTIINLGQNTPNVINDTTVTYLTEFDLTDWEEIGTTLGFDEADDATMGQKRAYMTWLWMQTAWNLTFTREPEGGSFQIGVIGTLGATAFYDTMTVMRLEMPLLTIATAVENEFKTSGLKCDEWYTQSLTMTDDQATALCDSSANFTWTDTQQTAVALTNAYLYQTDFNAFYFTEFVAQAQLEDQDMKEYFYGPDKPFTAYYDGLQTDIKSHYDTYSVCTETTLPLTACPFSKITYSQWLDGTILRNPLPGQIPSSIGYVRNYGDYATGWITPEYSFWKLHNGVDFISGDQLQAAIDETYAQFNPNGLFNGKKWQDVLLFPDDVPEYYPEFDTYCRSVTVNFGLSGLLSVHTPREMIEGYNDPLVEQLATMPIYEGGDSTTSPFLSLVNPPTHPTDNTVAFFTGVDDFTMTRQYGKWLDQEYIMMKGKQYTSITEIEEYIYSPWEEQVFLDGSDGFQFSPDLTEDSVIQAFVNDLSRNCYFDYEDTSDKYPGLDTYRFFIQQALMKNETANPVNANFQVKIDGTSNMTTSLNAYGFVAKGHYYQLSTEADDSKPKIVDQNGDEFTPDPENDDTYLGVERLSGVCLIAMERIFFNMAIYGDDLFQNFTPAIPEDFGYFFPLAFVKRESEWTQDQVDGVYGPLILGNKLKWSFFGILLGVALILLGLAIFFCLKYKKVKNANNVEPISNDASLRGAGLNNQSDGTSLLDDKDNNSEAEFENEKPHVSQNERVFNLRGQGKPIAELSDYTDTASGRIDSGQTRKAPDNDKQY